MQEVCDTLARGFANLSVATHHKQTALRTIAQWLEDEPFAAYRPQLQWLIEQQRWSLLLDSFYRMLPFGTGGRRGPVGIGINRFNPWTLASSVQGHVAYLQEQYPQQELSVVIAYDVRIFHDLRGLYNPALPNPLLGLTSRDLAWVAAGVYTANGVRVHMLPEDTTTYISTPELSFTIRHLHATAGLNISASHNHPDDNGGKFYNDRGGQEVPPYDEAMAKKVEHVEHVKMFDATNAKATGLISWIAPDLHHAYVALNVSQTLQPKARQARVVFTPLHGTADTTVGAVLQQAGFEMHLVAEQATHDGTFPAVPFRAPNPEVPDAMQLGIELARQQQADAVLACDPDADRIGVCSRTVNETYRFLTGNEIAVVVTHYKLEQLQRLGRLPQRPLVIKTEVTTELLRPITEHFDGTLIGNLLVGFKYHANVLDQLEREGHFGSIYATLDDFIIGVEESHGILVTHEIRDKDAAGAALLLAELAALQRQQGATLLDYLDAIYMRYGYYANLLTSMVMTGAEGLANIEKIQHTLRQQPPGQVAGYAVTQMIDHWDETGVHGPFVSETDRASRNMLVFFLENGARVIIRPSGTEPKNKIYLEVPAPPVDPPGSREALARSKAETDAVAQQIADDFTRQMLAIIGVSLPDYALRLSSLLSLDRRLDFVENFIPGFERYVQAWCQGQRTQQEVSQWIDTHLASYGKDARGLVCDALAAYLHAERQQAEERSGAEASQRRQRLYAMETLFFAPGT
jgi:phosphoglucomutase/phosphomannomutase